MNAPTLTTAPSPILFTDLLRCTAQVMLKENTWRGSKAPRFAVVTFPDNEILDTFNDKAEANEFFSDAALHFVRGDAFPAAVAAPYEASDRGNAAIAYQRARTAYQTALWTSEGPDRCPDWNAPEVIAAGILMEVTAMAYREFEGYICEDCGLLEYCCCPDGAPY